MEVDKEFLIELQDLIESLMVESDDYRRGRCLQQIISDGDADPVYLRLCEVIDEAKN